MNTILQSILEEKFIYVCVCVLITRERPDETGQNLFRAAVPCREKDLCPLSILSGVRAARERGSKVYCKAVHRVSACPFPCNLAKMTFAKFMKSRKMQIGGYRLLEGYKKTGPGPLKPASISKVTVIYCFSHIISY